MGRKKITITRIGDERNRQITFSKRKYGLLKKAYELSILCDTEIAIMMITSNSKLYQYASSNINEFLMKYTEIQEPFESKTNADVWQDVTRKEVKGEKDDSDEETERPQPTNQSFNPTNYEKINEEFDQMFKQNQNQMETLTVTTATTTGDSAPTNSTMLTTLPPTMPVAVPVTEDTNKELSQDQQAGRVVAAGGNVFNPMPPPQVPPRIQALKNPQLKLHLPGSGRNYIKLGNKDSSSPRSGGSSSQGSSGGELNSANSQSSVSVGSAAMASPSSFGKGSKPSLRVVIPASKGSHGKPGVVQTNATSTINQIQKVATTSQHNDPLATPIMSLATPSLFSNLPSMMSGLGDFPFNSNATDPPSALVAIPINLQQSSASGNVMLQAHNLGQPFLLTPTYEPNAPVFPSPGGTSVQGNSQEILAHYLLQQQQQMQKQQTGSNIKTTAKGPDATCVIEQSSNYVQVESSSEQDISFNSSMEHSRSTLHSYDPSLNSSTLELPVTKRVRLTS